MAGAFSEYYPEGMPDQSVMPTPDVPPSLWERLKAAMTVPTVQQSADRGAAGAAGILNMGGATAPIARHLGFPGAADWLENKEASDPGAAGASALINPGSLLGPIKDAGSAVFDYLNKPSATPAPKVMTEDEFLQAHQRPQMGLQESVDKARNDFMSSPAYKALVDSPNISAKKREAATQQVIDQAKQTWRDNQSAVGSDTDRLKGEYQRYLDDQNKQLLAQHSQSFAARNPGLATASTVGGSILAGLASKSLLGRIATKGTGLVEGMEDALKGGKALDFATSANKADQWANGWKGAKLKIKQGLAVAAPATIPVDLRGMGDAVDALAQPTHYTDARGEVQPNPVQREAMAKISDPLNYFATNVPSLVSGLVGSSLGAKYAKAAPVGDVRALLDAPGMQSKIGAFNDVRKATGMDGPVATAHDAMPQGAFSANPQAQKMIADAVPGNSPATKSNLETLADQVKATPSPSPTAKLLKSASPEGVNSLSLMTSIPKGKNAGTARQVLYDTTNKAVGLPTRADLVDKVMRTNFDKSVDRKAVKALVDRMVDANPNVEVPDITAEITRAFVTNKKAPGVLSKALQNKFGPLNPAND